MKFLYRIFMAGVMGLWALSAWSGWEIGSRQRGHIPQSVRQSPGGYRSYHYWGGGK
jgi:hypothetical protein